MKRFLFAMFAFAALAAPATAATYTYTTIAPPESTYTISIGPNSINANGDIVGLYQDGSGGPGSQHGFVYSHGAYNSMWVLLIIALASPGAPGGFQTKEGCENGAKTALHSGAQQPGGHVQLCPTEIRRRVCP